MQGVSGKDGRVMGAILLVLGAVALFEGQRLFALRTQMVAGAVVGDDTLPVIVGLAFVLLGGYFLLLFRRPASSVSFPKGPVRDRMLWSGVVLVVYCAAVPYLGYTLSTFAGAVGLYKAMGGYGWGTCLLLAAMTTGALHLTFRVWLLQPLPTGLLGI
jgi:putative tricarboxylic transport membrane protein